MHLRPLVAAVRRYQPYTFQSESGIHPLQVLKSTNNIDKYRELHIIRTYPAGETFKFEVFDPSDFVSQDVGVGADLMDCLQNGFRLDAEVAIIKGQVCGPNPQVGVKIQGQGNLMVEAEPSGYKLPLFLETISGFIELIINDVEAVLTAHPFPARK